MTDSKSKDRPGSRCRPNMTHSHKQQGLQLSKILNLRKDLQGNQTGKKIFWKRNSKRFEISYIPSEANYYLLRLNNAKK